MSDSESSDKAVGKLIKPINITFRPTSLISLGWVLGIGGLAGLVYFVLHFNDLELFLALIERADPIWLGAALICQILTYIFASLVWKIVLDRAHSTLPFVTLLKIGFLSAFCQPDTADQRPQRYDHRYRRPEAARGRQTAGAVRPPC
ncbi:lysylphosphatidylglycerol synthase transmembrane domain-containing protein [Neorhizobium sp. LjRoot104]|uniref:lysylphosphatidylglycerol synthase transmembrane domain-containing protein n=1 Tax=Neorhizobium sp. LjRoot104 TaxID=3342254 RepID=UPI003ED12320